jgi:hypothetical protein
VKDAKRGRERIEREIHQRFPMRTKLKGKGVQIVNVSFDVTQEVAGALRALRDTGLFGGGDCATVAEELLRRALLDPAVAAYWRRT